MSLGLKLLISIVGIAGLDVAPTLSTIVVFALDSAGSLRNAHVGASPLSGAGRLVWAPRSSFYYTFAFVGAYEARHTEQIREIGAAMAHTF